MKKFKEFKADQQYIAEVGPIGAAIMGAMGLWGAWATFKKVKEKIKGYGESQQEKKANRDSGVDIEIKKIDPDTGEEYSEIKTLTGSDASLDSDGVSKAQKEAQTKYNNLEKGAHKKAAREKISAEQDLGPNDKMTKELEKKGMDALKKKKAPPEEDEPTANTSSPETSDDAPETGADDSGPEAELTPEQELKQKGEAGEIEDEGEAMDYFKLVNKAPTGWENKGDADNPELVKKGEGAGTQGTTTGRDTSAADRLLQRRNSRMLKFGEFITEDLMKDLKLASKSRKDSEITLDDGTEIPMDAFTADILVKYIEGLDSSEKKKTIKQFHRTERAFMKVLGKAHEG